MDVTSGPEVADGEQGDGLGLVMLSLTLLLGLCPEPHGGFAGPGEKSRGSVAAVS